MTNRFVELASIDVSQYVEKKNGLTYLSWAWAVDQLLRLDPDASWEYGDSIACGHETQMVTCVVQAFGKQRRAFLPVMDHRNKPIPNPDAFAINTAMQRCLVKAIALHGLGLYIYAGEDVPRAPDEEKPEPPRPISGRQVAQDEFDALPAEAQQAVREWALEVIAFVEDNKPEQALEFIADKCPEADDRLAIWSQLPASVRTTLKRVAKEK
jgi:hypothetical protein